MKVAVFFTGKQKDTVMDVLKSLKEQSIPAVGYHIGQSWENLNGEEWGFHLQQVSHVVIPAVSRMHKARWFSFIIGFAIGSNSPVYVVGTDSELHSAQEKTANYASDRVKWFHSDELMDELQHEYNIDTVMQHIEFSKEELSAMGFALTEEAMVSAVKQENLYVVEHFLQIGFSADTLDSTGVPVLNIAARQQLHDIMQLLLQSGANVNMIGQDRKTTALMESAVLGDSKGIEILLGYGPDTDVQSASGQTALMMAVGEGNTKIALILLEYGCRIDLVDALGMTAYKYAKLFNHSALIEKMAQKHPELIAEAEKDSA